MLGIKNNARLAIDLGNNNTILTDRLSKASSQPSCIALHHQNKSVKAVGAEAYDMLGKTHSKFKVVKPLKGGVIADYDSASKMLSTLIHHLHPQRTIFSKFDCIISGVPFSTTEVERRALRDALSQFSSSKTFLLFEPIAAAIGMGLNITEPDGKFIVDIGGGITEAVIISLSGVVNHRSIRLAGDNYDQDIQNYVRKKHNIDISLRTAEQLKIAIGSVAQANGRDHGSCHAIGKDLRSGVPRKVDIRPEEITEAIEATVTKIEQIIMQTLEECPPELAGDIYANGIYLTGGASLLRGFKERLEAKVKIPVHQDPDAFLSVAKGINKALSHPAKFKPVLID